MKTVHIQGETMVLGRNAAMRLLLQRHTTNREGAWRRFMKVMFPKRRVHMGFSGVDASCNADRAKLEDGNQTRDTAESLIGVCP
jgi:hypothetical protein